MFICSVPEIPSMPIGRFLRHGHIFHPVRVLVCHSCAIICNSLVFWLLHSSTLSHNVKKLYIPVNLLYSGDGAEFISCARAGTEGSAGPPHCVGPLSGANAGSTLRPHPGLSFECDCRAGVRIKTFFHTRRVQYSTCREQIRPFYARHDIFSPRRA